MTHTHPTLPNFDYVRPETIDEASQFLASNPNDARPFLGGTDILNRLRDGHLALRYLVDVKNLDSLSDLLFDKKSGLTLGAAVTMNRVIASPEVQEHYPILSEACRSVAGYQLRNRATVVGNICNASPAGDTIGACLVLNGILNIHGVNGPRQESLADFFLGPGQTTLKAGDIITAINFPLPPKGCKSIYLKLGRNKLSDLSIVAVTVLGHPASNTHSGYSFRIALASVAPVPLVPVKAEVYLANNIITPQVFLKAAQQAADECSPMDDVRGSAKYRKHMIKNLTKIALTDVWDQLNR